MAKRDEMGKRHKRTVFRRGSEADGHFVRRPELGFTFVRKGDPHQKRFQLKRAGFELGFPFV